jgi:hypothetical protein
MRAFRSENSAVSERRRRRSQNISVWLYTSAVNPRERLSRIHMPVFKYTRPMFSQSPPNEFSRWDDFKVSIALLALWAVPIFAVGLLVYAILN